MDQANWWVVDIIADPAARADRLIMRGRSSSNTSASRRVDDPSRDLYRDEDKRRREETEKL
ncbi:MAG TPA: hypothetical protein VGU01_10710 [Sphingomicrobium sp.]|nr:hypothetical protein [Sphingomicrobium sp.]